MTRTAIQEERMRRYFIEAAKEIIRGEGVEAVSSRSVAERAGYSYATLYNYFKDIHALVFCCADDFMEECRRFVEDAPASKRSSLSGVTRLYASFMVQYPGIFTLLFLQKPSDLSTKPSDLEKIDSFFGTLTEPYWGMIQESLRKERKLTDDRIAAVKLAHESAVMGLLSSYISRRKNVPFKRFMEMIEEVSEAVLC